MARTWDAKSPVPTDDYKLQYFVLRNVQKR
nr:MAG TPA: hypothetical protein [Caudoviricetes sp.]